MLLLIFLHYAASIRQINWFLAIITTVTLLEAFVRPMSLMCAYRVDDAVCIADFLISHLHEEYIDWYNVADLAVSRYVILALEHIHRVTGFHYNSGLRLSTFHFPVVVCP
mmetsp:Transcript_87604/g.178665  ORF Transcript_87604/g.178665 Transcript_87604/m.178665 type:complete len:110 (+) Transcript_87604:1565-1894(+)